MRNRIEAKIRTIMAEPGNARAFSPAGILQTASGLFEGLARLRDRGYRKGFLKTHRLPCTVVSIGNITSGGTGKTPMTLYVARLLQRLGLKPVIISRGYKGAAEKRGGIVGNGLELLMSPEAAGDEPFMMAQFLGNIPVLVGRDRVASGRRAIARFSPDIILLDDGFQHRRLHRDIDIVLLDAAQPLGNSYLLPRGTLREPPDALARADALIFTRWHDDAPPPEADLPEAVRKKPTFRSRQVPYLYKKLNPFAASIGTTSPAIPESSDPSDLKDAPVFAFSAIADNKDFQRMLKDMGCRITGTAEFSDHHAWSAPELERIGTQALESGARLLATTQKDFSRLPRDAAWPLPLAVLGVLPFFPEETNDFDEFLKNAVEQAIDKDKAPLSVLAYLDGRAGHEKQTRGILHALSRLTSIDVAYRSVSPLSATTPVNQWSAYLRLKALPGWEGPPTGTVDLIIGTGAHTHIPMYLMKRRTGAPVVTCMSPAAILRKKIDLCFIPRHDRPIRARNVFTTLGPPNLSEAGNIHSPDKHLILVGGRDEKSHFWDTEKTLSQIRSLLSETAGRTWTISSSPRTPVETVARLSELAVATPALSFFRSEETPSGWIETAYAEHAVVWVTADSISMIYEALSAGCRVGILPVRWKHPANKFQRSIDDLVQNGYAVVFADGRPQVSPPIAPPLDEASRCAREILKRWWPRRLPV